MTPLPLAEGAFAVLHPLETGRMPIQKLTSTDGFIAFDLEGIPAVGLVRMAPKVLRDGAELLARSTTYAAASFGLQISGGSAGLNAKPDARDAALVAFEEEVTELVASGGWLPGPGTGVTVQDLAALPKPEQRKTAFDPGLAGRGAVAAAEGAAGSLDGQRVATVGSGAAMDAAATAAREAGAQVDAGSFDADCDVLLVAGKSGVLEHDLAATVGAKVVVPVTPVPVTARALAVLGRAGVVVVPDFLSTAAPLLAALDPDGGDPVDRVRESVAALVADGTGMWMAAVKRAEDHLRTWRDELPFGRPLA